MDKDELDAKKKVVTELLENIDTLKTKEEYLSTCIGMLDSIQGHEQSAILRLMLIGLHKKDDYRAAARYAADSIQQMYAGYFKLNERLLNGEDVDLGDVIKTATASRPK